MTTIWKGRGTRSAISITGRAVVLRKGVIDMEKRRNVEQHSDHLTTEKYTEVLVFFMGRKQESCFFKEPFPVYVTSPYFRPRIIAEFSLSKLSYNSTKNMLVSFRKSNMHYEYSRHFIQSIEWENPTRFSQRPWKSYFLTQTTKKIIHLNLENETCMNMCRNRNLPTCQWKHTQINPFTVKLILLITLLSWSSIDSPPLQFLALYPTT